MTKTVSIVTGSVTERTDVYSYFIYSCVFSIFIYRDPKPLIFRSVPSNGLIDFAGCDVVHMVGGFTGMVDDIIIDPRTGRFVGGQVTELYSGNKTLQALGTFILWFGWYGFNCGSTLGLGGNNDNITAKVPVNTTLGVAMGDSITTFLDKLFFGCYDISMGLNGVLSGLVSITANFHLVEPCCDDTVVHGFCGIWDLWAPGIF